MKFSEIKRVFNAYDSALYSPVYDGTRFGCDCGCGGDSYTAEEWQEECDAAYKAVIDMKQLCIKLGVQYDGI